MHVDDFDPSRDIVDLGGKVFFVTGSEDIRQPSLPWVLICVLLNLSRSLLLHSTVNETQAPAASAVRQSSNWRNTTPVMSSSPTGTSPERKRSFKLLARMVTAFPSFPAISRPLLRYEMLSKHSPPAHTEIGSMSCSPMQVSLDPHTCPPNLQKKVMNLDLVSTTLPTHC